MKNIAWRSTLFLVVACLFGCSSQVPEDELIRRARDNIAAGELNTAVIDLRNVLQRNRGNVQARALLGDVYLQTGDLLGAEKEFKAAVDLGAPEFVAPLLGQTLLLLGKNQEVFALDQNALPDEAKADLLATQARAHVALGHPDDAEQLINQAIALSPDSPYVLTAKAALLTVSGELPAARHLLEGLLENHPDYELALLLLANIDKRAGNLEAADSAYGKVIAKSYNPNPALLQRALVRLDMRNFDDAQTDVDVLKKAIPNAPGVHFAQGVISYHKSQYQDAAAALEKAVPDDKNFPQALLFMGLTQVQLGNFSQAEQYARRFYAIDPNNVAGRKLLATVELRSGNYGAVADLLKPVVANDNRDAAARDLLAVGLLRAGEGEASVALLQEAVDLEPESATAHLRLGAAYLAENKSDAAVTHLQEALRLDPKLQIADLLLVANKLQMRDFASASKLAEEFVAKQPEGAGPQNILGQVYLAGGDEERARNAFLRAREFAPGDPLACQRLAVIAYQANDKAAARSYLEEVLKHHRDDLPALMMLASLDGLEGDENSLVAHLQRAADAHPQAVAPRLFLARYRVLKREPQQAIALLGGLSPEDRRSVDVLATLARAQTMTKDYAGAKFSLNQLIEIQPNNAGAHYDLAAVYARLGEDSKVRAELDAAIRLEPKHISARVALARLDLHDNQVDEADRHMFALRTIAPERADVLALQAELANSRGNPDAALVALEQAYVAAPSGTNMIRLARQKHVMGDRNGAEALMEAWLTEQPADIGVRLALAGFYKSEMELEKASGQFRRVLELQPDNVAALNDLAWLLRRTDPKQALVYAEKAGEIAPESTVVLDTLALVTLDNGDAKMAERHILRALERSPANPVILFHSAIIAEANGESGAAIATLNELLKDKREFPERAEAEALLSRLQQ